jgi:aminoglycoside/choline kinase family phosphotransferase
MFLADSPDTPGILDFQDAVRGPITYDLVSLLRDCYVAWPTAQVKHWVQHYQAQAETAGLLAPVPFATFWRWFEWMGVQRHLKASGIFARLFHRDGKDGYLAEIPRTLGYIVAATAHYSALQPLHVLVRDRVLPAYLQQQALATCGP